MTCMACFARGRLAGDNAMEQAGSKNGLWLLNPKA